MVNRILQILKQKNLTASKFADEIGVQRSSISHILSERNKPSLELIQKILNTYPEISSEWLLTGKAPKIDKEPDLFSESQTNNSKNTINQKEELNFTKDTNVNKINSHLDTDSETKEDTFVNNKINNPLLNDFNSKPLQINDIDIKNIERIVIFYSDKTFKEYSPE